MPGLGTIVNMAAILIGGLLGLAFGKLLTERFQSTILAVCGVCVTFIGISGALKEMLVIQDGSLTTTGTIMLVICLSAGAAVGELLNLEQRIEDFGEWLKRVTGNSGDSGFVSAFVTASLTVCIGAMAVMGAINDGIFGDSSILLAKAIIDLILIMVLTTAHGKGSIFSAIPVGLFQGSITLLAKWIQPLMTDAAISNLSLVGSAMIFCIGLNLLRDKHIRVTNLLPALIFAVIWAFTPFQ